jgi:predicted nucleic acid-binding Zn ribbon protein
MSYRRGPRRMEQAFDQLADELAPETLLAEVQRAWSSVVGPAISAQAEPTAARGGVVTISCSASVWAQELDLMGPQIVTGLNAVVGRGSVQRLRCVAVGHGH